LFATSPFVWASESFLDVTVTVNFGRDEGQNLGSLFEVLNPSGKVLAGAGLLGAYNYNTEPQSNHHFAMLRWPEVARRLRDQRCRGSHTTTFAAWGT